MPHPLSNDLRERVVAHVQAGHSCHEAAARFGTSVSFVVNLMRRWRETGRVDPRPRGGFRHGKLAAHREFILARVAAQDDITMPELACQSAFKIGPVSACNFDPFGRLFWWRIGGIRARSVAPGVARSGGRGRFL